MHDHEPRSACRPGVVCARGRCGDGQDHEGEPAAWNRQNEAGPPRENTRGLHVALRTCRLIRHTGHTLGITQKIFELRHTGRLDGMS